SDRALRPPAARRRPGVPQFVQQPLPAVRQGGDRRQMSDFRADLDLIRGAALAAGRLALEHREAGLKVWSKEGGSPVTDADLAVDRLLRDILLGARPDYGWLSEETADNPDRLERRRI